MEKDKRLDYIRDHVKDENLLVQWAKECFELGKAVLKLQREIRKGPDKANASKVMRLLNDVQEEITDVNVCAEVMDIPAVPDIRDYKLERWTERIEDGDCL